MKTFKAYRISSPWISLEDRAYVTGDGRTIRKAGAEQAEAILIMAVHKDELGELTETVIRCPHCGWRELTVERVRTPTRQYWADVVLREGKLQLPAQITEAPIGMKARCDRCRRLSDVKRCGYGLPDLPVIIYYIGDRSTTDYPSLNEARKAILGDETADGEKQAKEV